MFRLGVYKYNVTLHNIRANGVGHIIRVLGFRINSWLLLFAYVVPSHPCTITVVASLVYLRRSLARLQHVNDIKN